MVEIPGISGNSVEKKAQHQLWNQYCLSTESTTFGNSNSSLIPDESLACGKWVVVNYGGKLYPGEITKREGNDTFIVNHYVMVKDHELLQVAKTP